MIEPKIEQEEHSVFLPGLSPFTSKEILVNFFKEKGFEVSSASISAKRLGVIRFFEKTEVDRCMKMFKKGVVIDGKKLKLHHDEIKKDQPLVGVIQPKKAKKNPPIKVKPQSSVKSTQEVLLFILGCLIFFFNAGLVVYNVFQLIREFWFEIALTVLTLRNKDVSWTRLYLRIW